MKKKVVKDAYPLEYFNERLHCKDFLGPDDWTWWSFFQLNYSYKWHKKSSPNLHRNLGTK